MSFILKSSVIRAINISLFLSSLPTIMFVMFSVHAALGGEVTKRKVFVTLSLLSVLNIYFNLMVVGFADVSEASVALKRIKVNFVFCLLKQIIVLAILSVYLSV